MDINDYNTKLASTRSRYRDAADSLKENYDERLKNIQDTHDMKTTKQRDNYIENKTELEKQVQDMGDNYNAITRETIDQKQNEYRDRVMAQKADYEAEMNATKNEFKQRLDDLSSSYRLSAEDRDSNNANTNAQNRKRYDDALNASVSKYSNEAKRAGDMAQEAQANFKQEMGDERRALMSEHRDERQNLIKQSSSMKNNAKSANQEELETLRKVQNAELNSRQAHNDQRLHNQRYQSNLQAGRMRESFEEMAKKMEDSTGRELSRLNEENLEKQTTLSDRFAKNRGDLERKLASVEESSSYLNKSNTEDRIKKSSDARVKNVIAQMDEQAKRGTIKEERLAEGFQQDLDSQALDARKAIEKKEHEINRLNGEVIGGLKTKHMENAEMLKQQQRNTEASAEESVLKVKRSNKNQVTTLHKEYGRQINALQDDKSKSIADLRLEQAKEQTAYLQNVQRNVRNEKIEMQDDFQNKFSTKVDQLNQKIAKLEIEQKSTIEKYEARLGQMQKQQVQKEVANSVAEEDRRSEDQRAFQRAFSNQQRTFDDTLKQIKRDVDTQLAKMKHYNEVQVGTITRDYDNQIMRERQESDKELKTKMATAEAEYKRFQSFHETQMNTIKDQYELKMEKLRHANVDANLKTEQRSTDLA